MLKSCVNNYKENLRLGLRLLCSYVLCSLHLVSVVLVLLCCRVLGKMTLILVILQVGGSINRNILTRRDLITNLLLGAFTTNEV